MALFGKKKPAEYCAICGKERKTGLLRGLFQTEIEDQYVCSDCYGASDAQREIINKMTMEQFKAHLAFLEENGKLKEQFVTTGSIEVDDWSDAIVFDRNNGFMCLDKNLGKTIFRRGELTSFVIREDDAVIFEGNADGITYYESDVPKKIMRLEHELNMFRRECRMFERQIAAMSEEERKQAEASRPRFSGVEPFRAFHVELYFDHPYWNVDTLDIDGPLFDDSEPDVAAYLSAYRCRYDAMERLADELMAFGFPSAGSDEASSDTAASETTGSGTAAPAAEMSQTDVAEALLRFKQLLDMGALTQEEFDAKKKQLLGL